MQGRHIMTREPISVPDANVDFANIMLQRSQQINNLQIRMKEHWHRKYAINIEELPNFHLTIRTYQINLGPSYIQDTLQIQRENNEFQINILIDDPQLVHLRIYSRHINTTRYQLWIALQATIAPADLVGEHWVADVAVLI